MVVAAVPASAQKKKGTGPDFPGTYELRAVTVRPHPINLDELRLALEANYPPALRAASVGALVEVRFRVDAQGVPNELSVTRSTHPEFDAPRSDRYAPSALPPRR